ncbi:flap structure-specific endonuclease [Thermoplasmatales archaeon SG8-52-4]|nr:MAG: flap structure-specific endonuclease [Thermoplasmatales archaeon SG8-52-4]
MGVDIGDLFRWEKISFKDLHDRVVVIDAHNVLHQFLASIRQKDGTPLKNSRGEITSHISGIFYRTANLVEAKIRPVYVFDGKPHSLKAKTLDERRKRKELAEKEWKEALKAGDLEKARTKAQQTSRVTEEIIKQCKELLDALGIPYIQAPSEGEAQASYMVKKGDAYAVGSQDYDCLLIGSPVLVRNLTSTGRRKLPGKEAYTKVHLRQIRLKTNLKSLGISQKQLIDMAILIGTDFNDGIKGIGPKKSLALIKKNGNVENALATIAAENMPSFEEIKEIRNIFLKPVVTDDYSINWPGTNNEQVLKILCDRHQFTRERIEPILGKYSNVEQMMKQKTLF